MDDHIQDLLHKFIAIQNETKKKLSENDYEKNERKLINKMEEKMLELKE